jgi:hypothetical protein
MTLAHAGPATVAVWLARVSVAGSTGAVGQMLALVRVDQPQ